MFHPGSQDIGRATEGCLLEEGKRYHLPLLTLNNTVVCPGESLPHRLLLPVDRLAVRTALEAEAPLNGLLAVVCYREDDLLSSGGNYFESVGCSVQIMKSSPDGINIIAIGRQRLRVEWESIQQPFSLRQVPVTIVHDSMSFPTPLAAIQWAASWPPWVYLQRDPYILAQEAKALFHKQIPCTICHITEALELSYWLMGNFPFTFSQRQWLLSIDNVTDRLLAEMKWMKSDTLLCLPCQQSVAMIADLVRLHKDGVSAHFVNGHAVVHDVITVLKVQNIVVEGDPQSEHSWFHGYAWQIIYCSDCGNHLGWKFSPVEDYGVIFFGLRRTAIKNSISSQNSRNGYGVLEVIGFDEDHRNF